MGEVCTSCGMELVSRPLVVGRIGMDLCRRGARRRLTRQQWVIFEAMLRLYPRPVHYDRLYGLLWDEARHLPDDFQGIVKVHVCRMRPSLSALGLDIRCHYGYGYALGVLDDG